MQKIIEAKHIEAYRGNTRVFADLSLLIEEGCNTAILGPNGSGKTSFLKLVSREVHPVVKENSRLSLFGLHRYNVWELRDRLGIVSHDLQHRYIHSSIGIHVILSGYYSSNDTSFHMEFSHAQREQARRIMERLGISGLSKRKFGEMSTGQQRRFLLGRALVHAPEALLLDEPTEGLDVQAAFSYFDDLCRLMREGTTVILATHHIHEILPEIGRVILLKEGKIFEDGSKEKVLRSEKLSSLFEYPLEVIKHHDYYRVVPAGGQNEKNMVYR
jgi:iron complex transport system ATP-binding protein